MLKKPLSPASQKLVDEFLDSLDEPMKPSHATNDVTLRDYFAAKAMAALISALSTPAKGRGKHICPDLEETAKSAYEYADALLKEGAK